ncbi:hypothetical protein OY671_012007, partial [Metschnikowia pulcherrima]
EKGWHGYWSNPGDAGFGLSLDWTSPAGAKAEAPEFPVPQTSLLSGSMNHVYEHDYAVLVPSTSPRDAKPGTTSPIAAKARWLACTDQICVPEEADSQGTVPVVTAGTAHTRFPCRPAPLPAPLARAGTFPFNRKPPRTPIPFPPRPRTGHPPSLLP